MKTHPHHIKTTPPSVRPSALSTTSRQPDRYVHLGVGYVCLDGCVPWGRAGDMVPDASGPVEMDVPVVPQSHRQNPLTVTLLVSSFSLRSFRVSPLALCIPRGVLVLALGSAVFLFGALGGVIRVSRGRRGIHTAHPASLARISVRNLLTGPSAPSHSSFTPISPSSRSHASVSCSFADSACKEGKEELSNEIGVRGAEGGQVGVQYLSGANRRRWRRPPKTQPQWTRGEYGVRRARALERLHVRAQRSTRRDGRWELAARQRELGDGDGDGRCGGSQAVGCRPGRVCPHCVVVLIASGDDCRRCRVIRLRDELVRVLGVGISVVFKREYALKRQLGVCKG